jgi:hypothetical protein
MKTPILVVTACVYLFSVAVYGQGFPGGFVLNNDPAAAAEEKAHAEQARRSALGKAAAFKQDIDRDINGKIERVDMTWCHFYGKVVGVLPEGINVSGYYEPAARPIYREEPVLFFFTHFPTEVAEGDDLPSEKWYLAKDIGVHTYNSPFKGPRGIHHLEYGIPVRPGQSVADSPQDMNQVLANARKARQEMDALMAARAATNQVRAPSAPASPPPSPAPAK